MFTNTNIQSVNLSTLFQIKRIKFKTLIIIIQIQKPINSFYKNYSKIQKQKQNNSDNTGESNSITILD